MLRKVAWVLTLLCMAFIFYMSSRSIEESRSDSARFMAALKLVEQESDAMDTDNGEMMQFQTAVRKNAHLIVFAGLGALYFVSVYGYFGRVWISGGIALLLTTLYGVSDEIHQIFTHRGASPGDVMIDALGGLMGIILIGALFLMIEKNKTLKAFFGRAYDFEPTNNPRKGNLPWKR